MARGFAKWLRKQDGRFKSFPLPSFDHDYRSFNKGRLEEYLTCYSVTHGSKHWLEDAFLWRYSEQGHAFWKDVCDGFGDQKLACEILQSWKEQLEWERGAANG